MTTKSDADRLTQLAKLREPFPANQINNLPKPYNKESPKGNCNVCGGYHGLPAMHLDYVGHAALTARFLDVDPEWTWEPLGIAEDGTPVFDRNGGMWIRLTICGVTRLGYGDAGGKSGANAVKEIIGDALRNAGMRFGAALDLWHKGDLHTEDEPAPKPTAPGADPAIIGALKVAIAKLTSEQTADLMQAWRRERLPNIDHLSHFDADAAVALLEDVQAAPQVEELPLDGP